MVNFDSTKEEMELIRWITKRAVAKHPELDYLSLSMDITATHLNGCKMALQRLLESDDFNFFHDVCGIYEHINRETGALEKSFLPRFSAKTKGGK